MSWQANDKAVAQLLVGAKLKKNLIKFP